MSRIWKIAKVRIAGDIIAGKSDVKFSRELAANADAREIDISIDSDGGHVIAMAAMLEAIQNHNALRITTRCTGAASSAAGILFLAGHNRLMTYDARLMIHSAHVRGDRDAGSARAHTAVMLDWLAQRTKLPRAQLAIWADCTTYFSAAQALRLGLCNGIDYDSRPTSKHSVAGLNQPFTSSAKMIAAHERREASEFLARRAQRQSRLRLQTSTPAATRRLEAIAIPPMPRAFANGIIEPIAHTYGQRGIYFC